MKYIFILLILCTNVIYAANLGNENNEYLLFEDEKSKYLQDIGFDNQTSRNTILADYYYYYKSNTARIGIFDAGYY